MVKDNYEHIQLHASDGYLLVKRTFDIMASLIALIILIIPFVIVSICIMVDDFGSPIYSQIRVGKNGKRFRMYKFRSMVKNADAIKQKLLEQNEIEGAMFKMKEDPRVTRVGRFIRKHSIDELPQLWNVLCGHMSIVGPRPPLPEEVAKYTDYDKQRLLVEPGCTGLWQVTSRNDVDFAGMVDLDLEYIEKQSIKLDLWIMFKTVAIIFKPNGAY